MMTTIIGCGDVGRAMKEFFPEAIVFDPAMSKTIPPDSVDVVHICIPYSDTFVDVVCGYIARLRPSITIIHSTVKVGTTQAVEAHAGKECQIVYSPVMGKHPDLGGEMRVFCKFVSSSSYEGVLCAAEILSARGIPVKTVLLKPAALELAKLLDTTYYGLCIAFHRYAAELCEKEEVPFDTITDWTREYNRASSLLGRAGYQRPVLIPPGGAIGGHCVVPNAMLLAEQYGPHAILDLIW